jgi:hypothetical protein
MSRNGNTDELWVPNYWFIPWNFTICLEEDGGMRWHSG